MFDYAEFTHRNIGFVSPEEQDALRRAHVFVGGVGGMGGAAVMCLARTGVGRISLTDLDDFELSNLNRQMVANLDTVGQPKAEATAAAILKINPECRVTVVGKDWVERLPELLPDVDVAINGTDDARASVTLMRRGQEARKTVIDAFASPLPSVYVVGPGDPRPEVTFGYPTAGRPLESLDAAAFAGCLSKELEYVLVHSSSADHVMLDLAGEVAAGKRKRFSFAPMVWSTGCLMAYEAVRVVLRRPGGPGPYGVFFNPWTWKVERPKNPLVAAVRRVFVRRFLASLTAA